MACPVTGSITCRCDKETFNIMNEKPTLKDLLRKLFSDHVIYTKFYINSVISDLPDVSDVATRLFANQDEIGKNLGSLEIIGKDNGDKLAKLLREHIECAATIINLAKNKKDLKDASEKLFANSAQVAKFISSINPASLQYETVKKEFDKHNNFVITMTSERLEAKYKEEIITFDEYYNHMLGFSDMLYSGLIAKQNDKQNDKQIGGTKPDPTVKYYEKYLKYKAKYLK